MLRRSPGRAFAMSKFATRGNALLETRILLDVKANLSLLEMIIEAARRSIAGQEKLVLQLHTEGQSDLAEMAQLNLEKMTADLEYLREVRRHVLSNLRLPHASSRLQRKGVKPKRRTGS